jgi:hypothetical protein
MVVASPREQLTNERRIDFSVRARTSILLSWSSGLSSVVVSRSGADGQPVGQRGGVVVAEQQLVVVMAAQLEPQRRLAAADVDQAPGAAAAPGADLAPAGQGQAGRAQAAGGGQPVLHDLDRGDGRERDALVAEQAGQLGQRARRTVRVSSETWIELIGLLADPVGARCPVRRRR